MSKNEVKLLHEYGLNPKDRRHKEEVEAACPMHITMPEVYELLVKNVQNNRLNVRFAPNAGGVLRLHQPI